MTSPVRTCVVGVGRLGAEHARILAGLPGSRLIGVYDTDARRAAAVAARTGTTAYGTLPGMLAEADAAVVSVPTPAHAEAGHAALDAGCHVLIEKPLTRTLEEADQLIAAAERAGRLLAVGHVERFNGVLLACEPWIERPRFIESLRLAPYQPRGTDVTVILDLMIHDIDLVLELVGAPPTHVSAVGVPVLSGSVDIANARLEFENGAVATITASRVSLKPLRQLRLFQPSGYASLDLAAGRGQVLRRRADALERPESGEATAAEGLWSLVERIVLEPPAGEPLARELTAFLGAIGGETTRLVTGREARDALGVALGITQQIEEFVDVVAQGA